MPFYTHHRPGQTVAGNAIHTAQQGQPTEILELAQALARGITLQQHIRTETARQLSLNSNSRSDPMPLRGLVGRESKQAGNEKKPPKQDSKNQPLRARGLVK